MSKEIKVRKHSRAKPGGGTTTVRRHTRKIQSGQPKILGSSLISSHYENEDDEEEYEGNPRGKEIKDAIEMGAKITTPQDRDATDAVKTLLDVTTDVEFVGDFYPGGFTMDTMHIPMNTNLKDSHKVFALRPDEVWPLEENPKYLRLWWD